MFLNILRISASNVLKMFFNSLKCVKRVQCYIKVVMNNAATTTTTIKKNKTI